ncbi:hexose transporter Hxt15p [Trichomonascus vanleenenianus]|uniref:hexose transporter Hxt15p n=1 Tax=Trichomonascus vanleenenianus TaxID=2268995 RepID=UPI003ECB814E
MVFPAIAQIKTTMKSGRRYLTGQLIFAVCVFGIMGAARGLDEGVISTSVTQASFIKEFGLDDPTLSPAEIANIRSNIVCMVQLGSIGGAVLAFLAIDKIGRVRSLQALLALWIVGVVIQLTAFGKLAQLYAGRLIAGCGIGMTSVVCPVYLVEVAPGIYRGACTCVYSGSVYLGIALGNFANWGTAVHMSATQRSQWVIPMSLQLVVSGIGIICSFCVLESPRWLIEVGEDRVGIDTLAALRGFTRDHEVVAMEAAQIYGQIHREHEERKALSTKWQLLTSLVVVPSNLYRFIIAVMIQILAAWSGANAVTNYAPEIFQMVGMKKHTTRLFATSMYAVAKIVASVCAAAFIIDFMGRKRAVYIGITTQMTGLLYIALFMYLKADDAQADMATHRAAIGATVMIYVVGIGWAIGWNSIQYLMNAEIFPLLVRTIASSIIMALHYANLYGCSKAMSSMILWSQWGCMLFFAVVCFVGLVFCFFFIPEVAGMELESVDRVFNLPWYKIGRYKDTSSYKST